MDDIATMSEDNPDVAPSLRQKIRVTKVMKLLRDELALEPGLQVAPNQNPQTHWHLALGVSMCSIGVGDRD